MVTLIVYLMVLLSTVGFGFLPLVVALHWQTTYSNLQTTSNLMNVNPGIINPHITLSHKVEDRREDDILDLLNVLILLILSMN